MKCPLYIPFIECINKQSELANKRPKVQTVDSFTLPLYLFVYVGIVVHGLCYMLLFLLLLLLLLARSAAAFISFALSQSAATVGEPGKPRTN